MKKVIGILGVAMIAAAMFFNTNLVNDSTKDISLSSLISLNNANATEGTGGSIPGVGTSTSTTCWGTRLTGVAIWGATWEYVAGHNYDCSGWRNYCEWSNGCVIDNP